MRNYQSERLNDIDGYLAMLNETLGRYSPDQRTLFAAALAERWFPVYEAYSLAAGGGNPTLLREGLDAVWNHAQGNRIAAPEQERLRQQLIGAAPEAGPAQTREALAAYSLLRLALECCAGEANAELARQAAVTAYEAVVEPVPGYPAAPGSKKQVWRQPRVLAEIARQQGVLMTASHPIVNQYIVDYLKREAHADPVQLSPAHLTLAMNLPEPGQLPGFVVTMLGGMQQGIPAEKLPDTLDKAVRGSESGSAVEDLRKLAASAEEVERTSPGAKGLSGAFQRLASLWDGLQNNRLPEEMTRGLTQRMEQMTSQAEKAHTKALETTMSRWTAEQRAAFTAALAERWLSTYEAFSAREDWGEPDQFRQILNAVWDHLRGRKIPRASLKKYSRLVIENAPDTEEFDAPEALTACEVLDRSLDCCGTAKNLDTAVSAALAACTCYAMMAQGPTYRGDDTQEEERLWQSAAVQKEIAEQVRLLAQVGAFARIDDQAVDALLRSSSPG